MDKTIVIGIGGTGLEAIRALRRLVVENRGSLAALPQLGFLYLDTTTQEIRLTEDNRKKWEVMGTSIMLQGGEYLIFQMDDLGRVIDDIGAYGQIKEWLPVENLKGKVAGADRGTPAAQQIRSLGRLAFAVNLNRIQGAFQALYNRLPAAPGGGRTQIYLICSFSGGTGSGMFLDMAYHLKEWTPGDYLSVAFLVFPSLAANRGPRYLPNAYAALLELNRFNLERVTYRGKEQKIRFRLTDGSESEGPPFHLCYLLSPYNQAGVELSLSALPEMIAQRIYLNFDSSFSDHAKSLQEHDLESYRGFSNPQRKRLENSNPASVKDLWIWRLKDRGKI